MDTAIHIGDKIIIDAEVIEAQADKVLAILSAPHASEETKMHAITAITNLSKNILNATVTDCTIKSKVVADED